MQNESPSLGAYVILFMLFKVSKEDFVHSYSWYNNQVEGTPRVTYRTKALAGKARGGKLECCFWEDAGSMRSLERRSSVW